jgi:hypothetical protein
MKRTPILVVPIHERETDMTETITTAETIAHGYRDVPVYRAGALAYLDSFGGMLPVSVLEVITPGYGWIVAPASGEIRVRLNVTRGGYTRSEVITEPAHKIVPRDRVRYRNWHARIDSGYAWVK